ncbi:MAG TPA: hypothetical protein VGL66_11345 [Caulobacteraceae bacterium]|jgi:hypothetical protein
MTKKTEEGADRRTVLAAAAVAGVVATPILANAAESMMKGRPATFKIDLGGVPLSERAATDLSHTISRAVLSALAQEHIKVTNPNAVIGPHPGWYGIILRPQGVNAYQVE